MVSLAKQRRTKLQRQNYLFCTSFRIAKISFDINFLLPTFLKKRPRCWMHRSSLSCHLTLIIFSNSATGILQAIPTPLIWPNIRPHMLPLIWKVFWSPFYHSERNILSLCEGFYTAVTKTAVTQIKLMYKVSACSFDASWNTLHDWVLDITDRWRLCPSSQWFMLFWNNPYIFMVTVWPTAYRAPCINKKKKLPSLPNFIAFSYYRFTFDGCIFLTN